MADFKKELRYFVFKIKDIAQIVDDPCDYAPLMQVARDVSTARRMRGKADGALECVVVESDWPEYDIVWSLIRDRMEGRGNIIEQQRSLLNAAAKRESKIAAFLKKYRQCLTEADSYTVESLFNDICHLLDLTFPEWCTQLNTVAAANGWPADLVEATGEEDWVDYYKDGYSPEDAFRDMLTYA